ncbi:MAG: pseudouridine-5'-phosphate glycosidase [Pseudomonadota bacterium]
MTLPLKQSPAVAEAQAAGRPLVALESTIISHGMPWPQNAETARAVEAEVRAAGAEPATIAVLDGAVRIGLSDADIDALAQARRVAKLSRADLAWALATGATGSTTVAATMILAARAGIAVFATGGIGGVHRGADATWDVSADLRELAQTPVTVVCAGAKALLDLPKTLEVLETLGVPVIGWRTDQLPAFYSRDSGLPVPLRAENAAQVARAMAARQALALPGGQLVCNPISKADEIPRDDLETVIEAAVRAAADAGVSAKEVTPFLLARIAQATGGRALHANIALIRANARLAATIARAMQDQSA